jgi:hypothetical protein
MFGGCDVIYQSEFVSVPYQSISDSVVIGAEWVEIIPPTPLKPYKSIQEIVLRFDNYDRKNFTDDLQEKILNLSDGRKTKIDAFLFDEKGEMYELGISGTGGVGGGISFTRKLKEEIINGKTEYSFQSFPADRNYTKLKIRSEIPIQINKIEWICYSNK